VGTSVTAQPALSPELQAGWDAAGQQDEQRSNPPPAQLAPALQKGWDAAGPPDDGGQPDSGPLAQIGAGLSGFPSMLASTVDTALGSNPILHATQKAINAVAGVKTPDALHDVLGGGQVNQAVAPVASDAIKGATGFDPNAVRTTKPWNMALRGAASALPFAPLGLETEGMSTLGAIASGAKGAVGAAGSGAGAGLGQEAGEALAPPGNLPGTDIPYKAAAGAAGSLVGGAATGAAAYGAGKLGRGLQSVVRGGSGPVEQQAVNVLSSRADNPEALDTALAQAPRTPNPADPWGPPQIGAIVPGSQPTLGQLVPDRGLANTESIYRKEPAYQGLFQDVDARQNAARIGALSGAERQGVGADTVGQNFRARLQELDAMQSAISDRANAAMESFSPDGTPAPTRDILRRASAQFGDAEDKLWDSAKQLGPLALDGSGPESVAKKILNSPEADPDNAGGLGPAAPAVNALAKWTSDPQGVTFDRARVMRSNLSKLLEGLRNNTTDPRAPQARMWLMQMKNSVDDMLQGGLDQVGTPGSTAAGAASMPGVAQPQQENGPAPGIGSTVYTPAGRPIQVNYGVVEGDKLVTSNNQDMTPNPNYPAALQPRDRTRAVSNMQVQRISSQLQPGMLGASTSTAEGAPIVGPDGVVESGNGRTLGIMRAYDQNPASAKAYRDYLEQQGFDTTGMEKPILVRNRTSPLSDEDRPAFTQEAGASPVLGMSASEQAAVDAGKIPDESLSLLHPGDVDSAANRDFVRSFAKNVLSPGEEAEFATDDARRGSGVLSLDGAKRIRNALLQKAYGDPQLVGALAESGDDDIKAFGGAMTDSAGPVATLERDIRAGNVDPAVGIAKPLREAANAVSQARARGLRLSDYLAQQDAFSQVSPEAESILRMAYGRNLAKRLSRAKLANQIEFYTAEAAKQQATGRLFGSNLGFQDILGEAERRYGQTGTTSGQPEVSGAVGQGSGENGNQARGPGNGAAGPGVAERGQGSQRILPARTASQSELDELNRRYNAAKQATRANPYNNRRGPLAKALMPGPYGGGDLVSDEDLVPSFFHGGKNAAADARELVKGVGREQAVKIIGQQAVAELRKRFPNGQFDAGAYQKWADTHAQALSVFPEISRAFATPARAQAELAAARETYETAAVKKWLGADPEKAIGQILGKRDSRQMSLDLMRKIGNDTDAKAGFRRAALDDLIDRSTNQQPDNDRSMTVHGRSQTMLKLSHAKFSDNLENDMASYSAIFDSKQMDILKRVRADLQNEQRTIGATAPRASTGTARDYMALRRLKQREPTVFGEMVNSLPETLAMGTAAMADHGIGGFFFAKAGIDMAKRMVGALRSARVEKVHDLIARMVADPQFASVMFAKWKPSNATSLATRVIRALGRTAPSLGAQTENDQ
jgi:hypothetical protein